MIEGERAFKPVLRQFARPEHCASIVNQDVDARLLIGNLRTKSTSKRPPSHVRRVKKGTPATHPVLGDELRALRRLQREARAEVDELAALAAAEGQLKHAWPISRREN